MNVFSINFGYAALIANNTATTAPIAMYKFLPLILTASSPQETPNPAPSWRDSSYEPSMAPAIKSTYGCVTLVRNPPVFLPVLDDDQIEGCKLAWQHGGERHAGSGSG